MITDSTFVVILQSRLWHGSSLILVAQSLWMFFRFATTVLWIQLVGNQAKIQGGLLSSRSFFTFLGPQIRTWFTDICKLHFMKRSYACPLQLFLLSRLRAHMGVHVCIQHTRSSGSTEVLQAPTSLSEEMSFECSLLVFGPKTKRNLLKSHCSFPPNFRWSEYRIEV